MDHVIKAGFATDIWDELVAKFFGAVDFVFDPLWRWYAIGIGLWILAFVLCFAISYFCDKCRAAMGILLLILTAGIASFLTGATKMRHVDKEREARAAARRTKPREESSSGGPFDWFK